MYPYQQVAINMRLCIYKLPGGPKKTEQIINLSYKPTVS